MNVVDGTFLSWGAGAVPDVTGSVGATERAFATVGARARGQSDVGATERAFATVGAADRPR